MDLNQVLIIIGGSVMSLSWVYRSYIMLYVGAAIVFIGFCVLPLLK